MTSARRTACSSCPSEPAATTLVRCPARFIAVDAERVLVLVHNTARGRSSGVKLDARSVANLFEVRNGKVTSLTLYMDRGRALADLGLSE